MSFRFLQRLGWAHEDEIPDSFSSSQPGYIVLLIDQSTSMNQKFPGSEETRIKVATGYVNQFIHKIIETSEVDAGTYRRRVFLKVYGYSDHVESRDKVRLIASGWPSEIASLEAARNREWVKPEDARGGTPMRDAFNKILADMTAFFLDPEMHELFRDSAPPIIIHVTDGEADELPQFNLVKDAVQEIWKYRPPQGHAPLVFHAHIPAKPADTIVFLPHSADGLDKIGKMLFGIASVFPPSWIRKASVALGRPIQVGSVGLAMNCTPSMLLQFLTVGSGEY